MPMNMPMGNKPNPKTTSAKAPAKMKGMDMPVPKKKTGNQQNMQDMQMNNKQKEQAQPATYTCVMHPEIHSPKPGNCPKCGMKLVKEKFKVVPQTKGEMNMPMSDTKEDKMPGMQMGDKPVDRTMGYKEVETSLPPRTVRYDLYIRDTMVTYGNKPKRAIAVNGQIPMPTLTFTEGDTAEI